MDIRIYISKRPASGTAELPEQPVAITCTTADNQPDVDPDWPQTLQLGWGQPANLR